jgi:hypothetical protein
MDNQLIFGGFLLFLAIWMVVLHLLSRLTGWAKLAVRYRSDGTFQGKKWRFQSVAMRMGTGYNNSVIVGASPRGLYMSLFFLFRPGHPALFVRWSEVSVTWKKTWGFRKVELRFQRAADVPVVISIRLAQKLAVSAGSEWPGPRQA